MRGSAPQTGVVEADANGKSAEVDMVEDRDEMQDPAAGEEHETATCGDIEELDLDAAMAADAKQSAAQQTRLTDCCTVVRKWLSEDA